MADEASPTRKIAAGFYLLLLLLGVFFYFAWSLVFNTWDVTKPENMGVYAMTILLVGFGITGYLLYRTPTAKAQKAEK
ncbi:MAG TPA: hypothetical protein VEM95_07375 [Thermoplasmata archaeon]|nr:hypothetical protein [Thermoplasmata archaeon]